MTTGRLREKFSDNQDGLNKLHKRVQAIQVDADSFDDQMRARNDLAGAISEAREFSAPLGSPDHIDGVAARYGKAAEIVDRAQGDLRKVAKDGLPAVWVGTAGAKASEVVGAASYSADQMAQKFQEAVPVLKALSMGIGKAQARHDYGLVALDVAASTLNNGGLIMPPDELREAKTAVLDGVSYMSEAAGQAKAAGIEAQKALTKLASEARARKVTADGLTDADQLVLADAAAPGGPAELNEILTANELKRSSEFMDKMSAHDKAEFDRLLSAAKSPQERAYLMKALAAGHDVREIDRFAQQIHGRSPQWLSDRLTPVVVQSTESGTNYVNYQGAKWEQGRGTCVASSTVEARAMIDPLYAFHLTTGGHPDDPEYDNPNAFDNRLKQEQNRVHAEGGGDPLPDGGMNPYGQQHVADVEVGSYTGANYAERKLDNNAERQASLAEIERHIDNGVPVPVDVEGSVGRHAMMIVGHEGDRLQVYNPDGTITWIKEDDFVHNRMGYTTNGYFPTAYSVYLPK
ncbi:MULTISPECIES: peptidoglycan-binding protein [unclassified Streptomyces]|uniref:peptidoglycan-binding protein n=1 Tax=unclassified Streptomyces TaxID=2593676 RepID=UPI003369C952